MFADNYSDGFVKYWAGLLGNTESVVLLAVGVGVVCIALIVFGGKWKK
jgi:hypothetical protein